MRWSGMTDWRPDKLARRMPFLQARARIHAALRQWFVREGFVEVETPILQVAPGAEVHLQGFATDWENAGRRRRAGALAALVARVRHEEAFGRRGAQALPVRPRVSQRRGSALHHPEFTMLEWYRAGVGYETIHAGLRDAAWPHRRARAQLGGQGLRSRSDARAAERRPGIRPLRRRRHAGDGRRRPRLAQAAGIAMHAGGHLGRCLLPC